jgi:thiol-disulfide isomerase/thioredoxin
MTILAHNVWGTSDIYIVTFNIKNNSSRFYVKKLTRIILFASVLFASVTACADKVDFSLKDVEGVTHKLSDYRGKWVLVNYWATWCPPCLEEIPELVHFHEDHKDNDAIVIGINFEKIELKKLKQFIDENFVVYPVLLSKPAPDSPLGPIPGLPTSFLVSPEGELVAKTVGPVTVQSIEKFINDQGK